MLKLSFSLILYFNRISVHQGIIEVFIKSKKTNKLLKFNFYLLNFRTLSIFLVVYISVLVSEITSHPILAKLFFAMLLSYRLFSMSTPFLLILNYMKGIVALRVQLYSDFLLCIGISDVIKLVLMSKRFVSSQLRCVFSIPPYLANSLGMLPDTGVFD